MIFIRHPRPDITPGLCYGRLDVDIHPEGHGQIEALVEHLAPAAQIVSSPALRCRRLAESIASRHGLKPSFDERLWEMNMGEWEGMAWADIPRSASEPWIKDPFNLPCPGGENFRQVQERVLEALEDLDESSIVVCHAGPIRAVQMAWLGLSFNEVFAQAPPFAEAISIRPPEKSG
jgi:alpha-ribazole phosphatase